MGTTKTLVGFARSAGFSVSTSQVQRAASDRLIAPISALVTTLAAAGHEPVVSPQIEQFLAWCRFRTHTTRTHELRILLWMDGWRMSLADLRQSLLGWLPP